MRPVRCAAFVLVLLASLVGASSAAAHAQVRSGPLAIELGWTVEPAITGAVNGVQVTVEDAAGRPVAIPAGTLRAQVSAAGTATTVALVPTETPGEARGTLVPTRPGTYAFRITGRLDGRAVDVASTCSARSFDCVIDAAEVQFPQRDPSAGELAARIARAEPRAQDAADTADTALWVAIGAAVLAAVCLGIVLGRALGGRRGHDG